MERFRLQQISLSLLEMFIPGGEASDPVLALQRHLFKQCHRRDAMDFSEHLMAYLVPEVDKLVQMGEVTDKEAGDFTAEVLGEVLGVSVAQRIVEAV